MVVTGPFESYAVADGHDGVINGIRMAGHVKTCRAWDQLFILRKGIFTCYKGIQCYSTASSLNASVFSSQINKCKRYFNFKLLMHMLAWP